MINLNIDLTGPQVFTATPRDSFNCCGGTVSWVFSINSQLTNETIVFLPQHIPSGTWWDRFSLTITGGTASPVDGIIKITQTGTWNYEIYAAQSEGPPETLLDPSNWIQKVEVGLLRVNPIVRDRTPSYSPGPTVIPAFKYPSQ